MAAGRVTQVTFDVGDLSPHRGRVTQLTLAVPDAPTARGRVTAVEFAVGAAALGRARISQVAFTAPASADQGVDSGVRELVDGAWHQVEVRELAVTGDWL